MQIKVGQRVLFIKDVRQFKFTVPQGTLGTIEEVNDMSIWVQMDTRIKGAEEWDNQVSYLDDVSVVDGVALSKEEDLERDTLPIGRWP
jgi:hypothetical protein